MLGAAELFIFWILFALIVCAPGCARQKHVQRADRAAYSAIQQKTSHTPWRPPAGYNVLPDPRARFYDPTCRVDPRLPMPAPVLYGYAIPELTTLDEAARSVQRLSYEAPAPTSGNLVVRKLDESAWHGLPDACLRRMLEFESVRREYKATYSDKDVSSEGPDAGHLVLSSE